MNHDSNSKIHKITKSDLKENKKQQNIQETIRWHIDW